MTQPLRFYTTESLNPSSKRAFTPEGFLLCMDVPIARVGTLLYAAGEIPVPPGPDGIIRIKRDESEVFHHNAILSFAGKPVTDEHPPEKVTPDNWKEYAIGTVMSPRRGDGLTENNLLLYADLLIQNRQAIEDIISGKREVSAGYDAEYEAIKPGEGAQHNIIGNHVALVARGRCGPICSIGDRAMAKGKPPAVRRAAFRDSQRKAFRDRIMQAFQTGDEEALVDTLERDPDMLGEVSEGEPGEHGSIGYHRSGGGGGDTSDNMGGTHVHIHTGGGAAMDGEDPPGAVAATPPPAAAAASGTPPPAAAAGGGVTLESLAARIDQLEQAIAILAQGEDDPNGGEEAPDENSPGMSSMPPDKNNTGDRRTVTRDTNTNVGNLNLAYQEAVSRAELLVPGMKHPTYDAAMKPGDMSATLCAFRRRTIDAAMTANGDSKDAIVAISGRPKNPDAYIKAMSCDSIGVIFNGASEMMRSAGIRGNTGGAANPGTGTHFGGGSQSVQTPAEVVAKINAVNRERYNVRK